MLAARLRWEALPPLWLIVLVIVPAVVLSVRFFYRREAGRVGRHLRIAMGGVRILAILLVLTTLWGPYTETVESQPFKRHLVLAIDTSESMGFRDGYESSQDLADRIRDAAGYPANENLGLRPRIQIVRDILGADRKFLEKLSETFRLHVYTFDSSPAGLIEPREKEPKDEAADRLLAALPRLKATGPVTRIGSAIRDLTRAFGAKNEPVAGILMFTDGNHTGGAPYPVDEARKAARKGSSDGIPVFPVAMGNPAAAVNISVSRIDAPEVVLAGDEVSFTVHVHARGLEGRLARLQAWVLDNDGKRKEELFIETEDFALPADDAEATKVTFRKTFHEPGTFDLEIGVPPNQSPKEAVEGDNFKTHVLGVKKLKMRVLLVADKPSYTYRFVSEALLRAEQTIAANLLLLSAEPMWPQPSSAGVPPIAAFPATKAELAQYDVVILLDVNPTNERIAPEGRRTAVLEQLEEWVKQGGGLVMQAGRFKNIPEFYENTPVLGLLPVVPYFRLPEDARAAIVQEGGSRPLSKRYKLTSAGLDHPIMRILRDTQAVKDFWDTDDYATSYWWYAPVKRTKSSATALAVRRDPDGSIYRDPNGEPHPLIAIQPYGLGKTLWLGTDEIWRMRSRLLLDPNLYYWRFWSGVIRHLATYRLLGGNKRIKIWVDRTDGRYRVGDTIDVEAKFLDGEFEPVAPPEGVTWGEFERKIKLRTPRGEEEEITLVGIEHDPPEGLFRATIHAGEAGAYRLVAETDGDEEPAEATFLVESKTIEMSKPLMDRETLLAVAAESGGKLLAPDQFRDILDMDEIPRTGVVRSGETHRTELWDRAWVLWLFVGLLAIEWILRRLNLLL